MHLKTRVKNPTDTAQTWVLASNTTYRNLMTVYLIMDGATQPTDPIYQNLKERLIYRLGYADFGAIGL